MSRDRFGIKYTPTTSKRIIRASQYIEQQSRNSVPSLNTAVDFGGCAMFHLTTACNPMVSATPGANGRGKLQMFNGTAYSDASTTVYKLLNDTTNTIAVGAYVLAVPGPGGLFHITNVDACSHLS